MAQWSTTYAGLVSLLGSYVEDTSTEFTAAVQGCINRAEERIFRDLDIAFFDFSVTGSTSGGSETTTKPVLDAPVISIFFPVAGIHAERRSYDYVKAYGGSGQPLYFYEDTDLIYWAPVPDAGYSANIRQMYRPDPLSASNTTNWLSTYAADLLLWASLVEAEAFLIAPERVAEFEGKYAAALGPFRGTWRDAQTRTYEPVEPTPEPQRTR